jgi:hypothetical protein
MSQAQRTEIMKWLTLIIGFAILVLQVYKYFQDTLELNMNEVVLTAVAVVLMRNPYSLIDLLNKRNDR